MLYVLLDTIDEWLRSSGLYRFVMVLDQLEFRVLAAALLAFLLVTIPAPRVIRWLVRQKIGDVPEFAHAQVNELMRSKAHTPTMGGVLIAGAILVSTFLLADIRNDYVHLGLFVVLAYGAIGAADDWLKLTAASRGAGSRQGLYSWEKLVFQLGIGLVVGFFAYRVGSVSLEAGASAAPQMAHVVNLPFQKTYEGALLGPNPSLIFLNAAAYVALMSVFMAGMSNAVNITDGMDGLASGIAIAVAIGLTVLAFMAGAETLARNLLVPYVPISGELAVLTASLTGACLGFLWWNCSPAAVFMGDTGSLCIGGLIGYIAVVIRQEFVVLLMAGVFIWEILSVVLQVGYFKWTKGRRIFRCAPYHHHLHILGWPEQKIVARFWIVAIILVCLGFASLKLR